MLPMAYLFLIDLFICICVSDDEKVNSIDTLQEFRWELGPIPFRKQVQILFRERSRQMKIWSKVGLLSVVRNERALIYLTFVEETTTLSIMSLSI